MSEVQGATKMEQGPSPDVEGFSMALGVQLVALRRQAGEKISLAKKQTDPRVVAATLGQAKQSLYKLLAIACAALQRARLAAMAVSRAAQAVEGGKSSPEQTFGADLGSGNTGTESAATTTTTTTTKASTTAATSATTTAATTTTTSDMNGGSKGEDDSEGKSTEILDTRSTADSHDSESESTMLREYFSVCIDHRVDLALLRPVYDMSCASLRLLKELNDHAIVLFDPIAAEFEVALAAFEYTAALQARAWLPLRVCASASCCSHGRMAKEAAAVAPMESVNDGSENAGGNQDSPTDAEESATEGVDGNSETKLQEDEDNPGIFYCLACWNAYEEEAALEACRNRRVWSIEQLLSLRELPAATRAPPPELAAMLPYFPSSSWSTMGKRKSRSRGKQHQKNRTRKTLNHHQSPAKKKRCTQTRNGTPHEEAPQETSGSSCSGDDGNIGKGKAIAEHSQQTAESGLVNLNTEGTKPGNGEVILGEADIGPTQQTETSAPEDCSESRFRSKDSAFREATEGPEQGGDGPMVDE